MEKRAFIRVKRGGVLFAHRVSAFVGFNMRQIINQREPNWLCSVKKQNSRYPSKIRAYIYMCAREREFVLRIGQPNKETRQDEQRLTENSMKITKHDTVKK